MDRQPQIRLRPFRAVTLQFRLGVTLSLPDERRVAVWRLRRDFVNMRGQLGDTHPACRLPPTPREFEQVEIVHVGETVRFVRMLGHVRSRVGKGQL